MKAGKCEVCRCGCRRGKNTDFYKISERQEDGRDDKENTGTSGEKSNQGFKKTLFTFGFCAGFNTFNETPLIDLRSPGSDPDETNSRQNNTQSTCIAHNQEMNYRLQR